MARSAGWQDCSEELAERLRWHIYANKREEADCSLLIARTVPHGGRAHAAFAQTNVLGALVERLRPLIRRTDVIEVDGLQGIGVVLKGADCDGVRAVFQRVRDALGASASSGGTAHLVAIGYAGSAAEWADDRDMDEAIRTAWKVRSLVTVSLPRLVEPVALAASTHVSSGQSVETTAPQKRRHAGARARGGALGHERRGPLWLLPAEGPSSPESEVLRATARSLGVPYVEIPARLPMACRKAVPADLARELRAVPIGRTRGMLTVAMHNPRDTEAVARLTTATGLTIFPVLAAPDELERTLRQLAPM
jgi:hypothetical protein